MDLELRKVVIVGDVDARAADAIRRRLESEGTEVVVASGAGIDAALGDDPAEPVHVDEFLRMIGEDPTGDIGCRRPRGNVLVHAASIVVRCREPSSRDEDVRFLLPSVRPERPWEALNRNSVRRTNRDAVMRTKRGLR